MEFRDKFVWVTIRSSTNPWMYYIYQSNEKWSYIILSVIRIFVIWCLEMPSLDPFPSTDTIVKKRLQMILDFACNYS